LSGQGKTLQALTAIKPPRPPFEDVRLLRLIGKGSFGSVYSGLWSGAPVAVKVLKQDSPNNAGHQLFEGSLAASLAHPNLVQTYKQSTRITKAVVEEEDEASKMLDIKKEASTVRETWIVQEWCDGGTLGEYVEKNPPGGRANLEILEICMDIGSAGSYLHSRGIIHGDLTANNVLLKTQVHQPMTASKGYVCKVCDFGLARILEGETQEIITKSMGTVTHMPPEIFHLQMSKLSPPADVYAFGILMWQIITGRRPYENFSAPQVVVQVVRGNYLQLPDTCWPELVPVYKSCTCKEPEERPSFDTLIQEMGRLRERLVTDGGEVDVELSASYRRGGSAPTF
jgi:serine/threonine protein kinase